MVNKANEYLIKSIRDFYTINHKLDTFNHVLQVAEISMGLAEKQGIDMYKCYVASLLHDVSTYMNPCEMLEYAIKKDWHILLIEESNPSLLHQRISAD